MAVDGVGYIVVRKKIILMLFLFYDNFGDYVIVYVSKMFFEWEYFDFDIIEVDMKDIYRFVKVLIKKCYFDDMVFIIGGGNMGDLYCYEEWMCCFIIKIFY